MLVYRICLARYADGLFASGRRARWNYPDEFVLYTASSRALACLENVVHRSGEGLSEPFRLLVLEVPDRLPVTGILPGHLSPDWATVSSYTRCQAIGSEWYQARNTAVLRVPSSIIPAENNFILHTRHPDFRRIHLLDQESFSFDARIKAGGD